MADVSDVSNALGVLIGLALYPSGASGEAASPVAGVPVRIEAGWPSPQSLDIAVAAGKAHVSIYPKPAERNTTRYPRQRIQGALNAATYTLTVAGSQITVGGTVAAYGQNLAAFVNGTPYIVPAAPGAALASLAAALQALIVIDVPGTTVVGAVITLPAGARPGAMRVGATATATTEIRRQEREFQISIWAPTPVLRDAVAKPVDVALATPSFIALPDGSAGRLKYKSTLVLDFDQKQAIYRRDLIYQVEFPTTVVETDTEILAVKTNLADQFGDPIATTYF